LVSVLGQQAPSPALAVEPKMTAVMEFLAHTIKVDEEVWVALHALSIPFVDKVPNDVLRRELLGKSGVGTSPSPILRPLAGPAP
jgi:hypothetical protein